MDGVPLRMPQAASLPEVKDDVKVTVPDYFNILQETEYEFNLENWVVTGLQSCFATQHQPGPSSYSSGQLASCPPYWMILSSPQQNRLASRQSSDFCEPNPRQRSHSLKHSILCTKGTISDSEDEEGAAQKAKAKNVGLGEQRLPVKCQHVQRRAQKAFVPDLLNPPACLSSLPHQRRKNLRQCPLSLRDTSTQQDPNTDNHSQSPLSHMASSTRTSHTSASTVNVTLRPDTCRNPLATSPPWGLPSSGSDSTAELLSALSPEERELLGAITTRGYSLHTAITALQRTGRQTPDQILSYLVACDHLCQLGYDMAQVEEALEMFQNCETKAEEFLHLLNQFNEMGFQKNTIKEVLLVHENHRDRALEELMMRVS
ncbi:ubiquitin-associated protein 1-like [Archocentrus centrarchus]|uniref:ubiquitin-associated protein 1-like n=1 Tax=Archocentrus centrarchus TaxID=63155 RepID=UPI0011E9E848|nr:ubiquitin-associated protein 1-like [Archocentrus centrarchus]